MSLGIIGLKLGMSHVFGEDGRMVPVTIFSVTPNYVTQIKSAERDGYQAIQVATGKAKVNRVNKARAGHFAKANVPISRVIKEFRITSEDVADGFDLEQFKVGDAITAQLFSTGQLVDVAGLTKGRGFTGVIRRWNFKSQPASHGNSLSHNAPGSIGQNQSPGRVFKGKKMAGQYGNERVAAQRLEVVEVDVDNQLLVIKGSVPGSAGNYVEIRPTIRKSKRKVR
jgi:large subunit ribosomal protein L3